MALSSPGVEVTVVDQSIYVPAASNSVPYVLLATAQNKISGTGVGVAPGTLAANAGKVFLMTSQRDLAATFGNPFFYRTSTGTPINGYELNEYGLLAASSSLTLSNRAFIQRADINLTDLVASLTRPTGAPAANTYWLDTDDSVWGIFQWNQTTGAFTNKLPIVITENSQVNGSVPIASIGSIGDYAVVTTNINNPVYYKNTSNQWVLVGSDDWKESWPTVQGANSVTGAALTAGNVIVINGTSVTVPAQATVASLATAINTAAITGVSAYDDSSNRLVLTATSLAEGEDSSDGPGVLVIGSGSTAGLLTTLGITAGHYNAPALQQSPNFTVPRWRVSDVAPRPTGSVWNMVTSVNQGANIQIKRYDAALAAFIVENTPIYANDWSANQALDPAGGGRNIDANALYIQYDTAPEPVGSGGPTQTFTITSVANPGTPPPNNIYQVDGVNRPVLNLVRGGVYTFNQSAASNSNHPIAFKDGDGNAYTTGVVSTGTPGQAGAQTVFTVPANAPSDLRYYCTVHGDGMGNTIAVTGTGQFSSGAGFYNNTFTYRAWKRLASGPTRAVSATTNPVFSSGNTFTIQSSVANSSSLTSPITATVLGTTAADFVAAVSAAGVPGVVAQVTASGAISLTQTLGGVIVVKDTSGTPLEDAGFDTSSISPAEDPPEGVKYGTGIYTGALVISNWVDFEYTASNTGPDRNPADGRQWYYSAVNQVDIMIQGGNGWQGYQNVNLDVRGFNLTQTNPSGPMITPTAPVEQQDGTALVYGDLWIDTSNLELYPVIKRWEQIDGADQWVTIDNTDQTTSNGVLFADARWAPNGTTDPITENIPTIQSLLTSNYLDLDAPNADIYPTGMLLFNTRRSGNNVKRFATNYFNAQSTDFSVDAYANGTSYQIGDKVLYNGAIYVATANSTGQVPTNPSFWALLETNAWVTAAGLRNDGSPYMGRLSVRQMVVASLKRTIDNSDTLREEQLNYNLIACPGYPELIPNMIRLTNERNNTAFVVGDTPMRLAPNGNEILAWATDSGGLGFPSGDGLTTSSAYLGVFYPSCRTTDLSGLQVVQPPSHMMLRTIIRNDQVAFPWLAPAGVRRGVIDNAEQIGYINAATGEFETMATGQGLRDVLYQQKINPITSIPGVGITNYGNKTEASLPSALDRINVARLVAFIRGRLQTVAKSFVFEPNDQQTRNELANAIDGLFQDILAKRGLYDYTIVCDLSNNSPATIDRNELYVDIAIEPVKAVEFIYIPVRIVNTGVL